MNKKIFTIPNLLSFIRIILVPIIVVLYLKKHMVAATVLVVVSGASDMLDDGFIARTFNQVSDLGKLLDPIADKLTMLAVVFLVAIHHLPMRVMLYVMMAKEGIMLLGALVLFKNGSAHLSVQAVRQACHGGSLCDHIYGHADRRYRFCVGRRTHSFGKMPVDNGRRMLCAYDCRTYPIYCHFILMNQGKYDFDAEKFKGANK